MAAQVFELLFFGFGGGFGVDFAVGEKFDEVAGFAAFDRLNCFVILLVVDAGLHHFFVDVEVFFDDFSFAVVGCDPLAALFDCFDGFFVAEYGCFPQTFCKS